MAVLRLGDINAPGVPFAAGVGGGLT